MEANEANAARLAIAGLRAIPALREVSQRHLARLVALREVARFVRDEVLCRENEPADAFLVVLSGYVATHCSGVYVAPIPPGGAFGFEATIARRPYAATLTALEDVFAVRFPAEAVLRLLNDSAALRQALRPVTDIALGVLETAEVIQLRTLLPGVPIRTLTDLLARRIAADFGDRVLVAKSGPRTTSPECGADGVWRMDATPPEIRSRAADFDYLFLDGYADDPPAVSGRGDFTAVPIVRGAPPPRSAAWPVRLVTILVDERSPSSPELSGFSADGPPPEHRHAPCWVRLDLEALRGLAPGSERELDVEGQESLGRWARALTQRRVGLALSGGGAWGFIHVVLLEGLARHGVPVDVVTSASMGSAIGAFFCAGGIDKARELLALAESGALDRAAYWAIANSDSLRRFTEYHLGPHALEHLTRRFHPVATDLNAARGVALDAGPLGLAVRASCSAPGIWQPTIRGHRHFVDGCVTHNLPSGILPALGAHLVFASNCYPSGPRDLGAGPLGALLGRVGRTAGGRGPYSRLIDLLCSGNLMLHGAGDLEARGADVCYDERPAARPLSTAMNFRDAKKLIDQGSSDARVTARLRAMEEKIAEFVGRWQRLKERSRPRRPPAAGAPA